MCRCDGIGRRSGLKIHRWRQRTGSSPVTGTKKAQPLSGLGFFHASRTRTGGESPGSGSSAAGGGCSEKREWQRSKFRKQMRAGNFGHRNKDHRHQKEKPPKRVAFSFSVVWSPRRTGGSIRGTPKMRYFLGVPHFLLLFGRVFCCILPRCVLLCEIRLLCFSDRKECMDMGIIETLILTTAIAGVVGTGVGGLIGATLQKDSNRVVSLLLSFAAGGYQLCLVRRKRERF